MEFKRAERVAELLLHEISAILQRDLQDPRVSLSTITSVKISDDLKNAKVYFVCDPKRKESAKKGFDHSKGFIKKLLSKRLKQLKYMPDIVFFYDDTLDYSSKIERLLKEVKKEDAE